jgi:hypothetical protein
VVQAESLALAKARANIGKGSEGEPGTSAASGAERREAKEAFKERDLRWLKGLRAFREMLGKVLEEMGWPMHRSFADRKRRLELGDYLSLFLLGLFNPVARTLRGLVAASKLPGVQRGVCQRSVSLGSFSETQNLVDPALLEQIFGRLSGLLGEQVVRSAGLQRERWLVRDSSLFSALPRMAWALYGGGPKGTATAVRLHVSLTCARTGRSRRR